MYTPDNRVLIYLMATDNIRYFDLLKEAVVARLRESHPGVSGVITEWKGQTIFLFQDDLLEKVNDQVSEKWF